MRTIGHQHRPRRVRRASVTVCRIRLAIKFPGNARPIGVTSPKSDWETSADSPDTGRLAGTYLRERIFTRTNPVASCENPQVPTSEHFGRLPFQGARVVHTMCGHDNDVLDRNHDLNRHRQGEQPNQDWAKPGRLFFSGSVFYHGAHAGPSLEGAR